MNRIFIIAEAGVNQNRFMKTLFLYFVFRLRMLIAALLLMTGPLVSQGKSVKVNHVDVELVSEGLSIQPGYSINVGIRMQMDEHWHTYWINPGGEVGIPTKISWNMPKGFVAGEIQWPYPEKFVDALLEDEPPLISYGYQGEVLLRTSIDVPADIADYSEVQLSATVSWLACKTMCIPGSAEVHLTLPVTNQIPKINEQWTGLFSQSVERIPLNHSEWNIEGVLSGTDKLTLLLAPPEDISSYNVSDIFFIPLKSQSIVDHLPQSLVHKEGIYSLTISINPENVKINDYIDGILISREGWRGPDSEKALHIKVPILVSSTFDKSTEITNFDSYSPPRGVTLSLTPALISAFIGGFILNLMPCVLPVLSLKVLSLIKKAGEDKSRIWKHGIVFTGGVLISFWFIAGIMMVLRMAGQTVGWGYQLQSPAFLVILILFLFLMSLNLFGVFEIGTRLIGLGSKAAHRSGYIGSFSTGVVAVIVATPCMAPFMGSAIAYAIIQPPIVAALVFTFLGLGLAAPYLLLSCFPSLLKFVPKPGAWMESFKQLMGFPLMGTVVWLLWVLGRRSNIDIVGHVMVSLVIMGLAAWILGRWGTPERSMNTKRRAYLVFIVLVSLGIYYDLKIINSTLNDRERNALKIGSRDHGPYWQPFTGKKLNRLRAEGKPVFINFTADWCLTCKVNEKIALNKPVLDQFIANGVTLLKADFTSHSPEIANTLAGYGRTGVPLYVFYGQGVDKKPQLLPQLLTKRMVLAVLETN